MAKSAAWGILISGRGSNLAALLDLGDEINVRLVVSSSRDAYGLLRAKRAGVNVAMTPFLEGTKRIDWAALTQKLRTRGVTHLVLAGFMKIVPPEFVAEWRGRIVNLHPSLLPAYPGLKSIERAHAEKSDIGISVHEVNEEVDAGRLILRRRCLKADEVGGYHLAFAEFLVHLEEQRALKDVVRLFATLPERT
ncbi:MAG: formyltransferase family protein [Bdellovibrionota bacterium]